MRQVKQFTCKIEWLDALREKGGALEKGADIFPRVAVFVRLYPAPKYPKLSLPASNRAGGDSSMNFRSLDSNPTPASDHRGAKMHQEDFHLSFQNFSGKSETMPCTPQETNFSMSRTSVTVHT